MEDFSDALKKRGEASGRPAASDGGDEAEATRSTAGSR